MQYLLPSRYCEVDRLGSIAWDLFGKTDRRLGRAKAVCNWCQANVKFGYSFARADQDRVGHVRRAHGASVATSCTWRSRSADA